MGHSFYALPLKIPKKQDLGGPKGPLFFALQTPVPLLRVGCDPNHGICIPGVLKYAYGQKHPKDTVMNLPASIICASLAALFVCAAASGGEIYQWTDEDGNVHYEDRPTDEAVVRRLDVASSPTDADAVQARVQARREARAAAAQVAAEAPPEMSKDDVRAEQQKRQEQCQMYRDRLNAFLQSARLYEEDDTGERTYLNEDQTMAARAKVEEQIQKYCGS